MHVDQSRSVMALNDQSLLVKCQKDSISPGTLAGEDYDFSTLYITLPHNLTKKKLLDLIERTFIRKVSYTLLVMMRKRFSLLQTIIEDITFGLVRMYVTPYHFSWTIFILDLH